MKGVLFAALGCSCWGLSGIFAKILFNENGVTALWLVTLRLIFAGMILLAISLVIDRKAVFGPFSSKRNVWSIMAFAFFGMMPSQVCYFLAIEYSNPAVATVLQYIFPVLIMVFSFIKDQKLPGPAEVLILVMVMTGVFLMSTHGDIHHLSITPRALFWGLAAAFAAMAYTVLPRRLIQDFGTLPVVGWGMLLGGLIILPFTRPWESRVRLDGEGLLLLALVVVVGTVLAYSGYLEGVKIIGPVRGSMIAGMEPVVSTIFTAIVLGVAFTGYDLLGMVMVIVAVTSMVFLKPSDSGKSK